MQYVFNAGVSHIFKLVLNKLVHVLSLFKVNVCLCHNSKFLLK